MRTSMKNGIVWVCVVLAGLIGATRALAAGDYVLATASTGGTYYPVGVALSTLVKVKLRPGKHINLTAINSAGPSEPEEDVYLITKTIFENLGFLQSIHKATGDMGLQKAVSGLPVPLHPGAARYFREAGVEIPARLILN